MSRALGKQWATSRRRLFSQSTSRNDGGRLRCATFGDGPVVVENAAGMREIRVENPAHIQQPLIESVVRELRGESGACPSTAISATRTSAVMDAVLRAPA